MPTTDATLVAWDAGGDALVLRLDEDRVELDSSRAWPPGSRPKGKLVRGGVTFWCKVHGSRRVEPSGRFHVVARLLDATRAELDGLVARLAEARDAGATDAKP